MNTLDMFAQIDKDIEDWRLKIRTLICVVLPSVIIGLLSNVKNVYKSLL